MRRTGKGPMRAYRLRVTVEQWGNCFFEGKGGKIRK